MAGEEIIIEDGDRLGDDIGLIVPDRPRFDQAAAVAADRGVEACRSGTELHRGA